MATLQTDSLKVSEMWQASKDRQSTFNKLPILVQNLRQTTLVQKLRQITLVQK